MTKKESFAHEIEFVTIHICLWRPRCQGDGGMRTGRHCQRWWRAHITRLLFNELLNYVWTMKINEKRWWNRLMFMTLQFINNFVFESCERTCDDTLIVYGKYMCGSRWFGFSIHVTLWWFSFAFTLSLSFSFFHTHTHSLCFCFPTLHKPPRIITLEICIKQITQMQDFSKSCSRYCSF